MAACPRANGRRGDRLAQVLRRFGADYLKRCGAQLSRVQHKALRAIVEWLRDEKSDERMGWP